MLIETERHGPHVVLNLNRPEKLNALNYELMVRLNVLERDDSVRCLVLTGQCDRTFRGDIAGFARNRVAQLRHERAGYDAAHRELSETRHRSRQRHRLRRGCETVEASSLAIAAEHASFAKPEIRLGFPPHFGGTQRLPHHISRKRANEMILTGETIRAKEALLIGLVNQVVPASDLLPACLRAVTRALSVSIDEGLAIEAAQFMIAAASPDAREGIAAFV
jgi:enoyl-CoA hydratase/carnithine racemase